MRKNSDHDRALELLKLKPLPSFFRRQPDARFTRRIVASSVQILQRIPRTSGSDVHLIGWRKAEADHPSAKSIEESKFTSDTSLWDSAASVGTSKLVILA